MIRMFNEVAEHKGDNLIQNYEDDLGYDIRSGEVRMVPAKGRALVYTGLHICLPSYLGGLITSRSGLTFEHCLEASTAGTIDAGFRGAVQVMIYNHSNDSYLIQRGDRIAQMVFVPQLEMFFEYLREVVYTMHNGFLADIQKFEILESDMITWPETDRGLRGGGSSGR